MTSFKFRKNNCVINQKTKFYNILIEATKKAYISLIELSQSNQILTLDKISGKRGFSVLF